MSRFKRLKVEKINDYPLAERRSKVDVESFGRPLQTGSLSEFLASFPDILAGRQIRLLARRLHEARRQRRAIIWGFGGHVIKVGLAPILVDLMRKGFITALATNGSGIIHDFEIGFAGHTSEDVETELKSGSFGMARETGQILNEAIGAGAAQDRGIGEALGQRLEGLDLKYPEMSVILQAHRLTLPLTVHVAIGTDIIHNHPGVSGEALGKGSLIDFQILVHQVSQLHDGGVYLNLGSAVILPEVFLKAVTAVRNAGLPLENFTTANLDFIQHYRPLQNVVKRPVAGSGTGIALTGHHEIMLPLLAAFLHSGPA